jgi:hypothetical protein
MRTTYRILSPNPEEKRPLGGTKLVFKIDIEMYHEEELGYEFVDWIRRDPVNTAMNLRVLKKAGYISKS